LKKLLPALMLLNCFILNVITFTLKLAIPEKGAHYVITSI